MRWVFIVIAAIVGAVAGYALAHYFRELHDEQVVGVYAALFMRKAPFVGAAAGAILIYLVSGARILFLTNLWRTRLATVNGKIKHTLSTAEEQYIEQLTDDSGAAAARLHLAISHLLRDEVEKSVQEFQQAQKQGAGESVLYNNAGVAMARRGNVSESVQMFQRAVRLNGHHGQPHFNLAHVYMYAVADQEDLLIDHALDEVKESLKTDGERAVHYNRRGLVLIRGKRYDEAIASFRKALELSEDSKLSQADSHTGIGLAQFGMGDVRNAAMQFALAVRLEPSHGRALANLGVVQLLQGSHTEALNTLQNASKVDPYSAANRNSLGYALCRTRSVNDGILEFREAILNDPAFFEPYYNLGKVYVDEELAEVAERSLKRAYELNSLSWENVTALAVVRMQQEQWTQAISLLTAADKLSPNQPLILTNLATCIAIDGDYIRAQEILQRAVELDEGNDAIHAQLAWVYLLQENVSMCGNELIVAMRINPNSPRYHSNYGLCQVKRGDYDQALSSFRTASSLGPGYVRVHYHIGYVYALQGKLDQAIKEWDQTQKAESSFVDCHVNLGVAYYQKGNYEQAVHEFKRVVVARQHRMQDFSNLGLALAKHGVYIRKDSRNPQDPRYKESTEKHKLAVDMFDRALALEPNNVMLHSNRGLACYFANRPEDALAEWSLVTKLDPSYARRRQKVMQSEFDESAISFAELNILERSERVPPRTPDYLYRLSPGYETEEWSFIIDDDQLADVPSLTQKSRYYERRLKALRVE